MQSDTRDVVDWQPFAGDVAWPTLALFGTLVLVEMLLWWGVSTGQLSLWVASPAATLAAYAAFSVVHEAAHSNLGGEARPLERLTTAIGWIAAVALFAPYPAFKVLHLQHHAHTNEGEMDPDQWVAGGSPLSVFLRCATIIPHYYRTFLVGSASRTAVAEASRPVVVVGLLAMLVGVVTLGIVGRLDLAFGLWVGPACVASLLLSFVFDWLPHYPHTRIGAYQDTRVLLAPGLGWLMFGQNYHLVHHLHPRVPFYRCGACFRANREQLAAEGSIIEGWKGLVQAPFRGVPLPPGQTLKVDRAERMTADSVTLIFTESVPFLAGQHVRLSVELEGEWQTRCFSICSAPGQPLALTIKRNPTGTVSSWLVDHAAVGMAVRVSSARGDFVYKPGTKQVLLIAGGSGITPIWSIAQAATADGAEVTVLQVDRTPADRLLSDRIEASSIAVVQRTTETDGRPDATFFTQLFEETLPTAAWLCGPRGLRDAARSALLSWGLPAARIHEERFGAEPAPEQLHGPFVAIEVLQGSSRLHSEAASNETVLQAAQRAGIPLAHACGRGLCGSCVLHLEEGTLEQPAAQALLPSEQSAGRVLACLSRPTSPCRLRR